MTTPDVNRFPGAYSLPDSRAYPFGLKPPDGFQHHFPGDWAVCFSRRTTILADANAKTKAKALHAEWAEKFTVLLKRDNPVAVELSPALASAISQGGASCRGFWAARIGTAIAECQCWRGHTKGGANKVDTLWATAPYPSLGAASRAK